MPVKQVVDGHDKPGRHARETFASFAALGRRNTCVSMPGRLSSSKAGAPPMLFDTASVLAIALVGVFSFWLINRLVPQGPPSRVLKVLVILLCAAAILERLGGRFG